MYTAPAGTTTWAVRRGRAACSCHSEKPSPLHSPLPVSRGGPRSLCAITWASDAGRGPGVDGCLSKQRAYGQGIFSRGTTYGNPGLAAVALFWRFSFSIVRSPWIWHRGRPRRPGKPARSSQCAPSTSVSSEDYQCARSWQFPPPRLPRLRGRARESKSVHRSGAVGNVARRLADPVSQIRTVPSRPPATSIVPSGDTATLIVLLPDASNL